MQKEEEKTVKKLTSDWEKLDDLVGNPSISSIEIKQQIAAHEEKQKNRFYKELSLFFIIAISILGIFTLSLIRAPGLFIAIEIGAVILGPVVYYLLVKRKKKERNVVL